MVVYLFLQGWRATLIPLLAVPVSLVGTFMFFPAVRLLASTRSRCSGWCWRSGWWWTTPSWWWRPCSATSRKGCAPKDAARKAMEEISGPVIGIALVLSAVFVPTAFIPGITGRLYQQFAVTIAISVILSAFNALTLSPALAGAAAASPKNGKPAGLLAQVLRLVQPHVRTRLPNGYVRLVRSADPQERVRVRGCWSVSAWPASAWRQACPPASCPMKTRATSIVQHAASQCRIAGAHRRRLPAKVEKILAHTPGVEYTTSVAGFSLLSFVRPATTASSFVS